MDGLCLALYNPLAEFLKPLSAAFPGDLEESLDELRRCTETQDWELARRLGGGCSPALLRACLAKDPEQFFGDPAAQPFVQFIGGQPVYEKLSPEEQETYWSEKRLETVIRQCIVVNALEPLLGRLGGIVNRVTQRNRQCSQAEVVQSLVSDPEVMQNVFGLMDSASSVQLLMNSLSQVVQGVLGDGTDATQDEADAPTTQARNGPEDAEASQTALTHPGKYLAKQKRKQRRGAAKKSSNPAQSILRMLQSMNSESEVNEMVNEMKTIDKAEMDGLHRTVTDILRTSMPQGSGNTGPIDIATILERVSDLGGAMHAGG